MRTSQCQSVPANEIVRKPVLNCYIAKDWMICFIVDSSLEDHLVYKENESVRD